MSDEEAKSDPSPAGLSSPIGLNDLTVRILSGVILVAVALLITWAGGLVAVLAVVLLGLTVLREWERLTGSTSTRRLALASVLLCLAGLVAFYLGPVLAASLATALLFAALMSSLLESRLRWTLTGLAYATWLVVSLISLRGHDAGGLSAILLVFGAVWATDTAAYFGGRRFGGPKLAPSISPNKTWSGAVSGVLATIVVCLAYVLISYGYGSEIAVGSDTAGLAIFLSVGLATLLSVVAQVGDLFESALKRRFGAKDTGTMLPGHGGFMDRVDGLVFASTAAFLIGLSSKGDGTVAAGLLMWGSA